MTSRLARGAFRRARRALLTPRYGALTAVRTQVPAAALTFDDGPHPVHTPALLELLARHGASATHFHVGEAALANPDLVRRTLAAGHVVGSHGLTHRSLVRLAAPDLESEVREGHQALGGLAAPLFRPPYGHHDMRVAAAVRRAGLTCVLWSGHAVDWRPQGHDELAARLRKRIRPGAIVLLHEALYTHAPGDEPDRTALLRALDAVLGELSGTISFVTVPELCRLGRPVRELGWKRGEDEFVAAQVREG